jgi:hypothetical protein
VVVGDAEAEENEHTLIRKRAYLVNDAEAEENEHTLKVKQ